MWWFHVFIYLELIDIINLLFVSKSLNEVVNGYNQCKDLSNLARTVINTNKLNDCFIKYFDKLIIRLCGQFTFNTTLYLRFSLESLKRQFCISNVLAHLFFCNRSPNSNKSNCRSCSQLFVDDARDFVSSNRHHLTFIFPSNKVFNKNLELLITKANLRHFSLDLLFHCGKRYTLVDSKQNRCLYFLVVKQPCELPVKLSEVWIRILINKILSISDDFLINGEYGLSSRKEKRVLFLDSCMQFVKNFYFDACKLLNADAFIFIYEDFQPNTLLIVNKPYLDYCSRKYRN